MDDLSFRTAQTHAPAAFNAAPSCSLAAASVVNMLVLRGHCGNAAGHMEHGGAGREQGKERCKARPVGGGRVVMTQRDVINRRLARKGRKGPRVFCHVPRNKNARMSSRRNAMMRRMRKLLKVPRWKLISWNNSLI